MTAPATGYAYSLPAGWVHLDVEPGRRGASVRRAVLQRVRREPRLAPHLLLLDRLLMHECTVAAASGAQRVSLLAEPAGERVVSASVTFVVEPTPRAPALLGPVRRSWVARAGAGSAPVDSKQWQLAVPWPGRPSVGLLTMASPCRPMWSLLEQTFEACAHSFRWTWSVGVPG